MQENKDLIRAMLVGIDKHPSMKNGGTLQLKDTAGKSCAITPTWHVTPRLIEAKFFQNSASEFLVRRLTKEDLQT
jgi:hypothetical protein